MEIEIRQLRLSWVLPDGGSRAKGAGEGGKKKKRGNEYEVKLGGIIVLALFRQRGSRVNP